MSELNVTMIAIENTLKSMNAPESIILKRQTIIFEKQIFVGNISDILRNPENMPQSVYLALQDIAESQDMAVAQGHDCAPRFSDRQKVVEHLMDASPWTLHPDHGCVRRDALAELDRDDSSPKPAQ